MRRNTTPSACLEGARRIDRWEFPEEAVREAVVNALVHRDYSIVGTDVMLVIFSDRLEVVSPGRLPNTVTPEGMRLGMRYARNQTLVNVMRDYGYGDSTSRIHPTKFNRSRLANLINSVNKRFARQRLVNALSFRSHSVNSWIVGL